MQLASVPGLISNLEQLAQDIIDSQAEGREFESRLPLQFIMKRAPGTGCTANAPRMAPVDWSALTTDTPLSGVFLSPIAPLGTFA
ncbi:MAG: hypothetical protein KGK07_05085 [Chloroflexota bacterium]|nr:hypothetical protein [Chloroflexota bacterium]